MRRPDPLWTVRTLPPEAATHDVPALARRLGVPEVVARLLWLREVRTPEAARAFLAPQLKDLAQPARLPDADRAGERIVRAVRDGERIAVCGDYDVDGMTGTALLVRFLRMVGADVRWDIPDREGDGYGLGVAAIERLADAGVRVAITVDNGIAAHEAIEAAVRRGVDVIVTDHHLPGPELPPAYALVTPHRRDVGEEGTTLCGCALAFKMAWAVADRLRGFTGPGTADAFRAFLRDAMGLVALATIADVVPLLGENRILVAGGLAALRQSSHPGLAALRASARLGDAPITTEDVAFRLAPRINAAGRLSRPDLVIDLLTCEDAGTAAALVRQIEQANDTRRRIEEGVLGPAVEQAQALATSDRRSLVVHGEGWHLGVIGIVAARLVDRHHRPTVVIGFDGARGRGSGRTPHPVDLHAALTACGGHLERYGGHARAAGLEIRRDAVEEFADAFEGAVTTQLAGEVPAREIAIDAEIDASGCTLDVFEAVRRLGPFGAGNPEPAFLLRGAEVAGQVRRMGRDQHHLAFALKRPGGAVRVVGFRQAWAHELVAAGKPIDLVAAPTVNTWQGLRSAELRMMDVRPHAAET